MAIFIPYMFNCKDNSLKHMFALVTFFSEYMMENVLLININ